jgi:ABC-type polysaccharide/polyol phosphate export permease
MNLIKAVFNNREMILSLALRDFQSRYAGTFFGIIWTLAQPLITVAVFYFVFSIGFKAKAPDNVPFILWFCVGLMAWSYFNDSLISIVGVVSRNSSLVKKTVFPVEVLPVIQTLASLIPHLIFVSIVELVCFLYGLNLDFMRIIGFYYLFAMWVLIIGIGLLVSALEVFWKDFSQALPIIMNIWFWVTPVVWDPALMPSEYHWVFAWNPMYYIVEGYRSALIYQTVALPSVGETTYYWSIAILGLLAGNFVFNRLKPEFADVL